MRVEKRGSGYRVRRMLDGKKYSLTFDHQPTKKEIEKAFYELVEKDKNSHGYNITFLQACEQYTESKKNILSASTYKEYKRTPARLSKWFLDLKIENITQNDINKQINELSLNRAPKTVRNYHGFISAILGTFRPDMNINTTLPQKVKKEPYIPTDDDIKAILEKAKGTQYELPIKLLCYGLRRSELCAITADDVDGDILHITKAKIYSYDKGWIIQNRNKTSASTRDIVIPEDIAREIKENGCAYDGHPNNITDFLDRTEKELGIPHFSTHKLRHYFASKMSAMGIPDADIMALGGWETDNVMKTVYRHSMKKEKEKREIADRLKKELFCFAQDLPKKKRNAQK